MDVFVAVCFTLLKFIFYFQILDPQYGWQRFILIPWNQPQSDFDSIVVHSVEWLLERKQQILFSSSSSSSTSAAAAMVYSALLNTDGLQKVRVISEYRKKHDECASILTSITFWYWPVPGRLPSSWVCWWPSVQRRCCYTAQLCLLTTHSQTPTFIHRHQQIVSRWWIISQQL